MNIQERIEALEVEFAEKIKALKAELQRENEFPRDNDEYWFISDSGTVDNSFYTNHYSDNYRLATGNFFQTEQQAEFAVEKLKVEAELRKFSRRPNPNGVKWFIVCADSEEVYTLYTTQEISQGVIYFESEEKAQQAIETVGEERIKKYIFGVEG